MYHIHIHLEPGMLFSDIIRPPKQIFAWLKHIALILQEEGIWFFLSEGAARVKIRPSSSSPKIFGTSFRLLPDMYIFIYIYIDIFLLGNWEFGSKYIGNEKIKNTVVLFAFWGGAIGEACTHGTGLLSAPCNLPATHSEGAPPENLVVNWSLLPYSEGCAIFFTYGKAYIVVKQS